MLQERRELPTIRLGVIQYSVVVIFSLLGVSFWYFQVVQHAQFQTMVENNHQRTLELAAPRGTLFDRNGRVLVENRNSFNISLVREQAPDIDRTIRQLAAATHTSEDFLLSVVDRHRSDALFRPIVLIRDATLAQVAAVAARRLELSGIIFEEVPTRHYPAEEMAAHLFGYVGEVNDVQLARPEYRTLHSGEIVGQSGVEQTYNQYLMGADGARRVVVNSLGREIETVGKTDAVEGKRLQLTIDYDLQREAERAFRASGYTGAAVFLDPRNGEILSMVSQPSYDPNRFAVGIDRASWAGLMKDRLTPLANRAIQGRYSPGSTFKIVVAVSALEENIISPDRKVFCSGGGVFHGRYHKCHLAGGHGWVDMYTAIEKSCNVYFYTVGNMVGIDKLHKWATALGLGVRSGIDLPSETEGVMPSSEWKLRVKRERWYPGETTSVSIGQGAVAVTPISQAVMIGTVASGSRVVPHLVRSINDGTGWKPVEVSDPSAVHLKPETLKVVRQGLWLVVNSAGTGGRARIVGRDVAGKTGTAQIISNEGKLRARGTSLDLRDHGWFVFFAPRDNPEIAGVVFAEHSEHGYLAAPIAKHVINTYFALKEGTPIPELPSTPAPVKVAQSNTASDAARARPGGGE